ncbi:hypothetical protein D9M71_486930 [compost metagenome]
MQGLVAVGSGEHLGRAERAVTQNRGPAQAGGRPRQFGAVPFDPRQGATVVAQARRGIEVGALGQYPAAAVGQTQADQSVHYRLGLAAFLHRQHGLPRRRAVQVAVAAVGIGGQGAQRTGRAVDADIQPVDLLIGLVDQRHAVARHAEGAAAVFVDPAAHGEARRTQALRHAVAP